MSDKLLVTYAFLGHQLRVQGYRQHLEDAWNQIIKRGRELMGERCEHDNDWLVADWMTGSDEFAIPSLYEDAEGGVAARVRRNGGIILCWWAEGSVGWHIDEKATDPEDVVRAWMANEEAQDAESASLMAAYEAAPKMRDALEKALARFCDTDSGQPDAEDAEVVGVIVDALAAAVPNAGGAE